ncbi:MAG: DUF5103 domain-containing protein [Bacteroidota bacterium]
MTGFLYKYLVFCALFAFTLLPCFYSAAQDSINTEFYNDNYLRYKNHTYKDYIKTIQLHKEGWELGYPFITLNSSDRLVLSFDDLEADAKSYSYTFLHCEADWTPSNLMQNEYTEGFTENEIRDYNYSLNTLYKYTHFSVTFPNEDIRLTLSGNYIVMVYKDFNKDSLILTRRFSILEPKVEVIAVVKAATILDERKYSQEIDFTINHGGYPINDPYGDVKVVVTQNNRWDNAITDLKPVFVKDRELVYDFDYGNVFKGGSEFRNFDIKSVRYQSQYIKEILYEKPYYHIYLQNDEPRRFKIYFYDQDINGRYYIKIQEGDDSNVEADYVYVHFSLPYDAPVIDGNFYVFGALSDWNFKLENRMKYNFERKAYECTILLKQGYYNYEYAFVKDGTDFADDSYLEGSHYETENDYVIYVYHHDFTSRYDRLVGVQIVNSITKK